MQTTGIQNSALGYGFADAAAEITPGELGAMLLRLNEIVSTAQRVQYSLTAIGDKLLGGELKEAANPVQASISQAPGVVGEINARIESLSRTLNAISEQSDRLAGL